MPRNRSTFRNRHRFREQSKAGVRVWTSSSRESKRRHRHETVHDLSADQRRLSASRDHRQPFRDIEAEHVRKEVEAVFLDI
jgi:hypothetical protein